MQEAEIHLLVVRDPSTDVYIFRAFESLQDAEHAKEVVGWNSVIVPLVLQLEDEGGVGCVEGDNCTW